MSQAWRLISGAIRSQTKRDFLCRPRIHGEVQPLFQRQIDASIDSATQQWALSRPFPQRARKGWGTDAKGLAQGRTPGGNGIARKNRSARGTAIGDYHSHEHYFANRNRIRNRFQNAQNRHVAAHNDRTPRISRFAVSWFAVCYCVGRLSVEAARRPRPAGALFLRRSDHGRLLPADLFEPPSVAPQCALLPHCGRGGSRRISRLQALPSQHWVGQSVGHWVRQSFGRAGRGNGPRSPIH
jgi:hypothetical protein